jgi:hypothetical protein
MLFAETVSIDDSGISHLRQWQAFGKNQKQGLADKEAVVQFVNNHRCPQRIPNFLALGERDWVKTEL